MRHLGLRFSFNIIWFNICTAKYIDIFYFYAHTLTHIWPMNDALDNRFSGGFCDPFRSPFPYSNAHTEHEFCGYKNKCMRSNCICKKLDIHRNLCIKCDILRKADAMKQWRKYERSSHQNWMRIKRANERVVERICSLCVWMWMGLWIVMKPISFMLFFLSFFFNMSAKWHIQFAETRRNVSNWRSAIPFAPKFFLSRI